MDPTTWQLSNDTRGWIMTIVSGIACVFGAAIICVDALIRALPGKRNFRIEESSVFQACSLSLSFGVMLFTSLYSMLPESKSYLKDDGWSDQPAGLIMMACFVVGFFGIQVISRLLHRYIPSHVVGCDHSHGVPSATDHDHHHHGHDHHHQNKTNSHARPRHGLPVRDESREPAAAEATPLLGDANGKPSQGWPVGAYDSTSHGPITPAYGARGGSVSSELSNGAGRRPSMVQVRTRVMSFVKDIKSNCDVEGSCYGFTDPCGQECFKHLNSRATHGTRHSAALRATAVVGINHPHAGVEGIDFGSQPPASSRGTSLVSVDDRQNRWAAIDDDQSSVSPSSSPENDEEAESQAQKHHHHVPKNAFLSIGLQTSIAIAIHKFPEGFITYATNHANPSLGFNVFLALFIHNISEGFAMALPLYMALGSRWRAMTWSFILGGLSQPLGAGLAVLWFRVASHGYMTPEPAAYACLFAVTAGIMVSVALQLFAESLSLNHDRNLCVFFGFIGMALLGFSNALFSSH